MKKFVIISVILLLLAAGAFGFALYRYMQVNDLLKPKQETAVTEIAASEAPQTAGDAAQADATEQPAAQPASTDIFAEGRSKAETYIADMTTEQMAGQLVLGICADTSDITTQLDTYSLAGMLFESGNFAAMSKEEITTALTDAAAQAKIKPILAAQEEGGNYTTVSDLGDFLEYDFNSPRNEFENGGLQAVEKAENEKATMLKSVGFNMNLAPAIDLAANGDEIMYSRTISDNVDTVSTYAEYAAKFTQ
ncbi:MAG: hypothetical protein IJ639_06335, partial [Ruminococcus sp.]|nr:hypothetical protein [Ruminococcus sp.]